LQAATVDLWAEHLEVLDEKAKRFDLPLIEPMLLYQHITADDLSTTPADRYHQLFQTGIGLN
jgi:hypothetical protein